MGTIQTIYLQTIICVNLALIKTNFKKLILSRLCKLIIEE